MRGLSAPLAALLLVAVCVASTVSASSVSVLVLLTHTPSQTASVHALADTAGGAAFSSARDLADLVGSSPATLASVTKAVTSSLTSSPDAVASPLDARDAVLFTGLSPDDAAAVVSAAGQRTLHPAVFSAVSLGPGSYGTPGASLVSAVSASSSSSSSSVDSLGSGGVPPSVQRQLLGIPDSVRGPGNAAGVPTQVWGPGTFGFLPSDLSAYYEQWGVNNSVSLLHVVGHAGTPHGDNFGEGTLDTTQSSAIGLGVPVWVTNTNTSSANEEGPGFGYAMLAFLSMLSSAPEDQLPGVLSMSLGSVSFAACDRLCDAVAAKHPLFSFSECMDYVQFKQRQVCMFPSADVANRIETEMAKVVAGRGVSAVAASGDGGSHYSFQPFDRLNPLGDALNKIACASNSPTYPASSAYVLGVGGLNPPAQSARLSASGVPEQAAWPASGGGFSWDIPRPSWQDAAVKAYLSTAASLPDSAAYNISGRAYPDVAVLGNDVPMVLDGEAVASGGTSASAPALAGFVSLIVNQRAQAGKPSSGRLGLLPKLIYQLDAAHPGELFDAPANEASASSACTSSGYCCPMSSSFVGTAHGFDPITGLGRPVFAAWSKYLGDL